jgi:prepilin-type N-terminal cleavage/methylation domain-containing protein
MKGILDLIRRPKFQKGFTLVELLVVIAIIGVLATLVLLQLGTARARARDTKRITDVNQIRTALEQYFEDNNGSYPTAIDTAHIGIYLTRVPVDPLDAQGYGYGYDESGGKVTKFQIYANLEQNAAALSAASAINATGWSHPGVDASGAAVACKATPNRTNCVYDQGILE